VLAGCSLASNKPRAACPLPSEQPFAVVELFFGKEIGGRGPLTDAEWSDFSARVISQQFPDGFTVLDGDGQWLDQRSGQMVREKSKILLAAADPDSDLAARIGAVTDAYRKEFHQQSVGVLTSTACGAF
jgi:hypothetical protein